MDLGNGKKCNTYFTVKLFFKTFKVYINLGKSKFTAPEPHGPYTFLRRINTPAVKIKPVFKKYICFIK